MTEKLYDNDAFLFNFKANVIKCEKRGENFLTELDKTAFFPESGGQFGDSGTIDGVNILDTQYDGDRIVHISTEPITEREEVLCEVEFEQRFRKMQNHTGEHIVSSIMHRRFGFNNVGFHLGKDEMTFDFDGEITKEQMAQVEKEANRIVCENVSVRTYYPTENELDAIEYRSKGEVEGKVRIVEIDGVDKCACCAPHVGRTGQIGIIKILGFIRYKGGIRIRMLCGLDALDDFKQRIAREEEISHLLCVPQSETVRGVKDLTAQNDALKYKNTVLKKELIQKYAEDILTTKKNVCFFKDGLDMADLREMCNLCAEKCKIFAAFSGDDTNGYLMVIASKTVALRAIASDISTACRGKCGGSDAMLSGRATAKKDEIIIFFEEI